MALVVRDFYLRNSIIFRRKVENIQWLRKRIGLEKGGQNVWSKYRKTIKKQVLPIRSLIPTQAFVRSDLLNARVSKAAIVVIYHNKKFYIHNGHHRAAYAVLTGKTKIQALVVRA